MLEKATIQLLRFPFSLFLMPVFWFALSETENINGTHTILVFGILHLLVYPASNGYNSYMDRDTESIGGVENPLPAGKQLFYATIAMDLIALLLGFLISPFFVAGTLLYILASRAYSYRRIRVKQYPFMGYALVTILQGAGIFFLVMHGCSVTKTLQVPTLPMLAASLLIGSFYPLSQIYQHRQDQADGVTTISYVLGYRGTFYFSALVFGLANLAIWVILNKSNHLNSFIIFQLMLLPVTVYFVWWFLKVWKDQAAANFKHTMQMNLIASICSNTAFIFLWINQ